MISAHQTLSEIEPLGLSGQLGRLDHRGSSQDESVAEERRPEAYRSTSRHWLAPLGLLEKFNDFPHGEFEALYERIQRESSVAIG